MKKNDPRRSFWHAVHRGDLPALRAALKAGADPDQAFPLGKASASEGRLSPLLLAARCGQTEVCRELLAHGADVSGGHAVLTPLLEAAACGHAELVALFKRHKARGTFFTQVALGETAAAARALKKDPGLAHAEDELGQTPLHYAARALNLKAIALLLKHGADPNAPSRRRVTPLHAAANLRNADGSRQRAALEALIRHGANVNARDWRGVTPLHMAVRSRSVAACEVLLAAGAETNAADGGRGSTPLRRAVANTGAGGTKGRTAEALAIAKLLLEHGADPKARDARGRPLERSAQGAAMRKVLRSAKKRA